MSGKHSGDPLTRAMAEDDMGTLDARTALHRGEIDYLLNPNAPIRRTAAVPVANCWWCRMKRAWRGRMGA